MSFTVICRWPTCTAAVTVMVSAILTSSATLAEPLDYTASFRQFTYDVARVVPLQRNTVVQRDTPDVPSHLQRRIIHYSTHEAPGTVIVDPANTYLYFVLGNSRAIRYGIGVARKGFAWSGVRKVARKVEWPDWIPPAEMLARQPYLPRFMAGGPGNPLGARAMYLGGTLYRIHGTNDPTTIGKRMSSGCVRMLNNDVIDLYRRVKIGTKVVVLPIVATHSVGSNMPARALQPTVRTATVNIHARGLY